MSDAAQPWPYDQEWPAKCNQCDSLREQKADYTEIMIFGQHFVYHIPESEKKDDDYKFPKPTHQTEDNPLPPEGCLCASFWTVRQAHKSDCPLAKPVDGDK